MKLCIKAGGEWNYAKRGNEWNETRLEGNEIMH